MFIELSSDAVELIKSVAARRGKSVEQFILDAIARKLNPKTRVEISLRLSEKYLTNAEELYRRGDSVQALED